MRIKYILQNHGLTLMKFSEILNISRPTLNSYICLFEEGKNIPNDKIQLVFEDLFNKEHPHNEFLSILNRYSDMLRRDAAMGMLDVDSKITDLVTSVVENIKADCKSGDYDEKVYLFINMLIGNYKNDVLFSHLIEYFLVLNDIISLNDIDFQEKPYLLHYFYVLDKDRHHELMFDAKLYQSFVTRVSEIKSKREVKEKKVQDELMEKIRAKIQQITEYKPDIEQDDLMQLVLSDLKKD